MPSRRRPLPCSHSHAYDGIAHCDLRSAGMTGVLAFREELDLWLNPELLTVTPRDTPMLDPFTLREKAEAFNSRTVLTRRRCRSREAAVMRRG